MGLFQPVLKENRHREVCPSVDVSDIIRKKT